MCYINKLALPYFAFIALHEPMAVQLHYVIE